MHRSPAIALAALALATAALVACGSSNNKSNQELADARATIAALQKQLSQAAPQTSAPSATAAPPATAAATAAQAATAPATKAPATATAAATAAAAATKASTPALGTSGAAAGATSAASSQLPAPGGQFEVPSAFAFVNSASSFHVVGEVKNGSGKNAQFVKIAGTFYDANKKVVASETTYALRDPLPAGENSPFDLFVSDGDKLGIASYKLQVTGDPTTKQPLTGLTIQGDSGSKGSDAYRIVGEVMNTTKAAIKNVEIIATLYDASGKIVDVDSTYVQPDTIEAGDTNSFQLDIYDAAKLGVTKYSIIVQGQP